MDEFEESMGVNDRIALAKAIESHATSDKRVAYEKWGHIDRSSNDLY